MSDKETSLRRPLFNFTDEPVTQYGGNQWWFERSYLQNSGCGVIACANILTQLFGNGGGSRSRYATCRDRGTKTITRGEYMKTAGRLKNFYLPVIPGFGINGVYMGFGMALYFLFNRLPYRVFWGISRRKRDQWIADMLASDIPVCLAIGPNFPNLFGKKRLTLYRKGGNGFVPDTDINAHYVSVTAMTDEWYEISSWGRKLYINRREYNDYVRKSSCSLFSNVLVVKEKG